MTHISQNHQKFAIQRLRNKVKVFCVINNSTVPLSAAECELIDDWVKETQIGYRVAWDTWQLKSKDYVTMFMMKWALI